MEERAGSARRRRPTVRTAAAARVVKPTVWIQTSQEAYDAAATTAVGDPAGYARRRFAASAGCANAPPTAWVSPVEVMEREVPAESAARTPSVATATVPACPDVNSTPVAPMAAVVLVAAAPVPLAVMRTLASVLVSRTARVAPAGMMVVEVCVVPAHRSFPASKDSACACPDAKSACAGMMAAGVPVAPAQRAHTVAPVANARVSPSVPVPSAVTMAAAVPVVDALPVAPVSRVNASNQDSARLHHPTEPPSERRIRTSPHRPVTRDPCPCTSCAPTRCPLWSPLIPTHQMPPNGSARSADSTWS